MPTVARPLLVDWSTAADAARTSALAARLSQLVTQIDRREIIYSFVTPNAVVVVTDRALAVLLHHQGRRPPRILFQDVPYVGIAEFVRTAVAAERFVVVEEAGDDLSFPRNVLILAQIEDDAPVVIAGGLSIRNQRRYTGYLIELDNQSQSGWVAWETPPGSKFHGRFLPIAGQVINPVTLEWFDRRQPRRGRRDPGAN